VWFYASAARVDEKRKKYLGHVIQAAACSVSLTYLRKPMRLRKVTHPRQRWPVVPLKR